MPDAIFEKRIETLLWVLVFAFAFLVINLASVMSSGGSYIAYAPTSDWSAQQQMSLQELIEKMNQ